ncbi:MAG: Uma2 family endonuclease [Myxococcota bacterium]
MVNAQALHNLGGNDQNQRWFMDFEDVPETLLHDTIIELLKLIFKHRFSDSSALVASNMACRWDPNDARVGVDPDVILVMPAPPEGDALKSLRVWQPDHRPPKVAIEVVSETNADKDYIEGPARLAKLGAEELWIFDPELHGPKHTGGPFVLQVWRRIGDQMERVYAGSAPAYSPELEAWLVTTDDKRLRIADDKRGINLWLTSYEAEKNRADAAEAEIKRLRKLLAQKD